MNYGDLSLEKVSCEVICVAPEMLQCPFFSEKKDLC